MRYVALHGATVVQRPLQGDHATVQSPHSENVDYQTVAAVALQHSIATPGPGRGTTPHPLKGGLATAPCNARLEEENEMTRQRLITVDGGEILGFVWGGVCPVAVVRYGTRLRLQDPQDITLADDQDIIDEATQALEEREALWAAKTVVERVEALLDDREPMTVKAIAKELQISEAVARAALHRSKRGHDTHATRIGHRLWTTRSQG